jgi:hypothetical protein
VVTTFEQGFAEAERAGATAERAAQAVLSAARQMKRAAGEGNISAIRKAADRLAQTVEAARQEAANARSAWPFGDEEEEAYLRDAYAEELLALAQREGLEMRELDGRLIASPSVLRIAPADRAVQIDGRRVSGVRPSRVVTALKASQTKKPRLNPARFLETLYKAYQFMLRLGKETPGATVQLTIIYDAFTLLPGVSADYSLVDFSRDLFLLDRSGLRETRSGARFSLPASTGTRTRGTLRFMSRDGEMVTYYGIRFTEPD